MHVKHAKYFSFLFISKEKKRNARELCCKGHVLGDFLGPRCLRFIIIVSLIIRARLVTKVLHDHFLRSCRTLAGHLAFHYATYYMYNLPSYICNLDTREEKPLFLQRYIKLNQEWYIFQPSPIYTEKWKFENHVESKYRSLRDESFYSRLEDF